MRLTNLNFKFPKTLLKKSNFFKSNPTKPLQPEGFSDMLTLSGPPPSSNTATDARETGRLGRSINRLFGKKSPNPPTEMQTAGWHHANPVHSPNVQDDHGLNFERLLSGMQNASDDELMLIAKHTELGRINGTPTHTRAFTFINGIEDKPIDTRRQIFEILLAREDLSPAVLREICKADDAHPELKIDATKIANHKKLTALFHEPGDFLQYLDAMPPSFLKNHKVLETLLKRIDLNEVDRAYLPRVFSGEKPNTLKQSFNHSTLHTLFNGNFLNESVRTDLLQHITAGKVPERLMKPIREAGLKPPVNDEVRTILFSKAIADEGSSFSEFLLQREGLSASQRRYLVQKAVESNEPESAALKAILEGDF